MDAELGAWLRQQREDRGWNKHEMARRLIQAGRDSRRQAMPDIDSMLPQHPPLGTRRRRLRTPQAPLLPRPRHPPQPVRPTPGRRALPDRADTWLPPPARLQSRAGLSRQSPRRADPQLPGSAPRRLPWNGKSPVWAIPRSSERF